VVFTAPDALSVHCLNIRDGLQNWKIKQDNDIYLGGVFNGKVLLVGNNGVRALNLADGTTAWNIPNLGLPSGYGVASKGIYYLPLKNREIVAIDIDKGRVR